ncbi:MAG: VanZ family protein [Gammaproteobacteria bacterium]|nr:VanZ family protein [Gammaproteobacteria bacterium]
MRRVLGVVIIIITYGSLYPFNFNFSLFAQEPGWEWFWDLSYRTSRGDILGNVLLFVPAGFFGFMVGRSRLAQSQFVNNLSLYSPYAFSVIVSLILIIGSSFIFATLLQLLQMALPTRVASMSDTWANVIGSIVGATIAVIVLAVSKTSLKDDRVDLMERVIPIFLVFCWLGFLLFPFIPSLSLEQFQFSFRPLMHWHLLTPFYLIEAWLYWSLFWWLLDIALPEQFTLLKRLLLLLLIMLLQALLLRNIIALPGLIGALTAVLSYQFLSRIPVAVLVGMIVGWLLSALWYPFQFHSVPSDITIIPFANFFHSNTWNNSSMLLHTVFLLGSAAFLITRHPFEKRKQFYWYAWMLIGSVFLIELGLLWFDNVRVDFFHTTVLLLLLVAFDRYSQSIRRQESYA